MNKNGEKDFYDYADDGWAFVKDLAYRTKMEIVLLAAIGGLYGGTKSHQHERAKESHIPTAFSEIESTRKQLAYDSLIVPPLTRIYSVINDVPMKVFESSNIAMELTGNTETFARELETRVDKSRRVYALISEYAEAAEKDTKAALQSLDKYVQAQKDLPPILDALKKSWDEDHDDIYRTEYYTTTECDSDGKNCHDVTHSREVYDHTIHTYDYDRAEAVQAQKLINAFIKKFPDLEITEKLIKAKQTGAWNDYAMYKSMQKIGDKDLTPEQRIAFANTWANTNHFTRNAASITSSHNAAINLQETFNKAVRTGHSDEYTTYSRSDSGPEEYQIMEKMLGHCSRVYSQSHQVTGNIEYAGRQIPALNTKIKEFIGVALDKKPGDQEKLQKEVLKMAQELYKSNFVNGFDVDPYNAGNVFLFTLLGIALGAGAGAGVDVLVDRYKNSRNNNPPRSKLEL